MAMKKQLLLLVVMLLPMVAWAYDIEVKNADGVTIYYNYSSDGTKLIVTSGVTKYTGKVAIPDEVTYMNRTRKVTGIEQSAFRECSGLTSVIIGNSVTNIDDNTFNYCTGLTSVNIGNGVTSIGNYAFYGCSGLHSVTIPNNVTSIGDNAFYNCYYLISVTIGNGVTSIGDNAFYNCPRLQKVIVSDIAKWCGILFAPSVSNPLYYAKHLYSDENTEIKELVIPNNVTSIGDNAFYSCTGLTSVTIGNSVTSIGDGAFSSCSGLTSVTIGNGVTSIGGYAFRDCSGLTSVTIPNSVTSIGDGAFYYCTGLTSVNIGNSVTRIRMSTFYNCFRLTSVTIPNNVTSIGDGAFSSCSGLTSVTIGNSVTSIGNGAFSSCSGLTSVTIPNSVTSIGSGAFYGADISTVISLIENPFTIYDKTSNNRTFSLNTFNNATLFVPKGTLDKYKTTGGWKDFIFIEENGTPPTPPTPQKCEKPAISYKNGQLNFTSATEGAEFVSEITDSDIKKNYEATVTLTATYNISVYAMKTGHDNSDVATATLCWIDQNPATEGITDGIANIPARALLIKNNGGQLTVEGAADGEAISVYTVNGMQSGSAISQDGAASIDTNLQAGSIAIVKIGDKSVKVVIK